MTIPSDEHSARLWTPRFELDVAVSGGAGAEAIAHVLDVVRRASVPPPACASPAPARCRTPDPNLCARQTPPVPGRRGVKRGAGR